MTDLTDLTKRIDAEFSSLDERIKRFQGEQLDEYHGRQARLKQFDEACSKLREVWKSRLETLAQRFGDRVKVSPRLTPTLRQVEFAFQSELAQVHLKFSAATDSDVRNLVLCYDLEILPLYLRFQPHVQAEFPLGAVDEKAIAAWLDDRIVDFVRTYLSLHESEPYLRDHLVEDPIARVKLPKFAAKAKLEQDGKTLYFLSEETRDEYLRSASGKAGIKA